LVPAKFNKKVICLGNLLKNFFLLLINDLPADQVKSFPIPDDEKHSKLREKKDSIGRLLNKNGKVCIVGPWGSGKSTLAKTFTDSNENKKEYSIRWASFASITHLSHAFYQLTFRRTWLYTLVFVTCLFGLAIYLKFNIEPNISILALAFTFLFFYTMKARLAYIFLSLIMLLKGKNNLVVIDDLDRCSLSFSEQFALLSNLFPWRHKYIVTYGYHDNSQVSEIFELVKKLDIPYILVYPEPERIVDYAKFLDERFPFSAEEWMSALSFRDIETVVTMVKNRDHMLQKHEVKLVYIRTMFDLWCKKFNVENMSAKIGEKVKFDNYKRPLINSSNQVFSRFELSFGTTVTRELQNYLHGDSQHTNKQSVELKRFFTEKTLEYSKLPIIDI
jgi:energy-coupling factor transporter ATP-binding protein EcfA2